MLFSSTTFLFLFLPCLLIVYYFSPFQNRTWKNATLLIFSVLFYAWGEPKFVFVMLTAIFVNWLLVMAMARSKERRKIWLTAAILFDVLLLGVFKYASFLSENLARLTGDDRLLISIALPIGISFFTFQLISYVVDVYNESVSVQKNPFRLALYISFFPQLIAGPIVRYRQLAQELTERRDVFLGLGGGGARRFVYGLGKKVLLANFLGQIADNAFDYSHPSSVMFAWLGALAYSLQIYFDFSGYSDMALGLGRLFGFHLPENFNYPYIAGSVSDFWKRWHITLTTWFRDYVYIPLGGNRCGKTRWISNLLVVWLLTGFWHGANWTFVLWGLIYFLTLLFEKLTGFGRKTTLLSRIWTFLIVVVAWVFFRSSNVAEGVRYLLTMVGIGSSCVWGADFAVTLSRVYLLLVVAMISATPLLAKVFQILERKNCRWIEWIWLTLVFYFSIFQAVGSTYNPFIYYNF